MVIKLFGAFLIGVSSTMLGLSFRMYTNRRIALIENFCQCLKIFSTQIRCYKSDIICSWQKAVPKAMGENKEFINEFLGRASENNGKALSQIWNESIESKINLCFYTDEDKKLLHDFSIALGSGDTDTQINNIDELIKMLDEVVETAKNKTRKSDDLYAKLGIYAGALVIIFLF